MRLLPPEAYGMDCLIHICFFHTCNCGVSICIYMYIIYARTGTVINNYIVLYTSISSIFAYYESLIENKDHFLWCGSHSPCRSTTVLVIGYGPRHADASFPIGLRLQALSNMCAIEKGMFAEMVVLQNKHASANKRSMQVSLHSEVNF